MLLFGVAILFVATPAGKRITNLKFGSDSLGQMEVELSDIPAKKAEINEQLAETLDKTAKTEGIELKNEESISYANTISEVLLKTGFSSELSILTII